MHQLTGQRHFPRPVYGEGTGRPLWLAIDVEHYPICRESETDMRLGDIYALERIARDPTTTT